MTSPAVRLALVGFLATAGAGHTDPSSREKWLAAVDLTSSTWSREALLNELLKGTKLTTRDQAIQLLGPPNYTADLYSQGRGSIDRIDEYRLSAENTQTFRFDSDASGRLKNPVIDGGGCACLLCLAAARNANTVLTGETVSRYLATLKTAPAAPTTIGAVERDVGRPGLHDGVESEWGRRHYWATSVIWRLAHDRHRFFIVNGTISLQDRTADADLPIGQFAILTISDVCLAP